LNIPENILRILSSISSVCELVTVRIYKPVKEGELFSTPIFISVFEVVINVSEFDPMNVPLLIFNVPELISRI
jgi:hypothetical protein